jgi:hypothetical protein
MMSLKHVMHLVLVLVFAVQGCGSEHDDLELDVDQQQRLINEKAFAERFNREEVADEESGIQIQPGSAALDSLFERNRGVNWKTVLMTGDDSINAFDNARKKLHEIFAGMGMKDFIHLSRKSSQQVGGVRATSVANFEQAVSDLDVGASDACLIHMTSHGNTTGFYIRGQSYLTPAKLDEIAYTHCGNRPTVLLISACYSGVFAEPFMERPNRIILTAARKDRTSFGCSAEATYTYWDGCLITNLPQATTWLDLSQKVEECIERKESAGGFARSYPQARFGALMSEMAIRQE